MKKLLIIIATFSVMNVWSIEIEMKFIKTISVDGGVFGFYCINGYQYVKSFRAGTVQMFEDNATGSSKPIKCSMDKTTATLDDGRVIEIEKAPKR